jgi:chemotaxis protein CheD
MILPSRSRPGQSPGLDGRYCDEAIARFIKEVLHAGTLPPQFQVYLVGGGTMHTLGDTRASVGTRNVEAARKHLQLAGFLIQAEHVHTDHHRKVELDLSTGVVIVTCNQKHIVLKAS